MLAMKNASTRQRSYLREWVTKLVVVGRCLTNRFLFRALLATFCLFALLLVIGGVPVRAQADQCHATAYYSRETGTSGAACTDVAYCRERKEAIAAAEQTCRERGSVFRVRPVGDGSRETQFEEIRWTTASYPDGAQIAFHRWLLRSYRYVASILGASVSFALFYVLRRNLARRKEAGA